ncbi:hypothetical protein BH24ACT1_BH24ACT1_11470 [soil metagenome]
MGRLLIAVLLASTIVACSRGEDPESAAATTSSTKPETNSTTTASASSPAGRLATGALLEGDPRWLRAPKQPTTKRFDGECVSLADQGWQATCGRVASELGDAIWIREHQGLRERVLLYVHREADVWNLALRAADDSGDEFDSEVFTADLAGDGNSKVVVTLNNGVDRDTDGVYAPVEVGVVEPSGEIVVHMVLRGGRSGPPGVTIRPGEGLEVSDCPVDCVPTGPMRVRLISYTTDGWRVADERQEARS